MHGTPEGTDGVRRRVPRAWLVAGAIFAAYLGLRLVQGLAWLVQQI